MQMPTVYEFEPRRSVRRFLSLMLIVGLVASGRLGYAAYLSRDTVEIGIAGIVTVATLVIWAIRAGATVTRLTVKSGQLEIARQGGRMVFDLALLHGHRGGRQARQQEVEGAVPAPRHGPGDRGLDHGRRPRVHAGPRLLPS